MARRLRIKIDGPGACYHVVTRTRGRDFLLDDKMKTCFTALLMRLRQLYYVEYAAYAVLDDHYHLLLRFEDPADIDPEEAMSRWNAYHADTPHVRNMAAAADRERTVAELTDISYFMKRFNHHMTFRFNWTHGTMGTLWAERFRSSLIERGAATVMCAAYIDLNAFRASLVSRPEDYPHCSLHALVERTPARDLLCRAALAEGLRADESDGPGLSQLYRAYVYASGAGSRGDSSHGTALTRQMQQHLDAHGLEVERGQLATRVRALVDGIVTATEAFARSVYDAWIDPWYLTPGTGKGYVRMLAEVAGGLVVLCAAVRGSPKTRRP